MNLSEAFSVLTFFRVLLGQLKQYKSLEKNLTTKELGVLTAKGEQTGGEIFRNSFSAFNSYLTFLQNSCLRIGQHFYTTQLFPSGFAQGDLPLPD